MRASRPSKERGRRTAPPGPTRSSTSITRSRATRGAGCRYQKSNRRDRDCLWISRMSRNPLVTTAAVRAPFLSRTAFVATVDPWTTNETLSKAIPASPTAFKTPIAGSRGVDGTFPVLTTVSPSTITQSVKVPPHLHAHPDVGHSELSLASGFTPKSPAGSDRRPIGRARWSAKEVSPSRTGSGGRGTGCERDNRRCARRGLVCPLRG